MKSTKKVNISKYMTESTHFEARFRTLELDKFPVLSVSSFPYANYHHYICPLVITQYTYMNMSKG